MMPSVRIAPSVFEGLIDLEIVDNYKRYAGICVTKDQALGLAKALTDAAGEVKVTDDAKLHNRRG